jgi:hypothetical protein
MEVSVKKRMACCDTQERMKSKRMAGGERQGSSSTHEVQTLVASLMMMTHRIQQEERTYRDR